MVIPLCKNEETWRCIHTLETTCIKETTYGHMPLESCSGKETYNSGILLEMV